MSKEYDNIRKNSDDIVEKIDQQALKNFQINLELNNYKSELRHALHRIEEHTYCPGQVPVNCLDKKGQQEFDIEALTPEKKSEVKVVHGEDCHCSKCCPNPNPTWIQKNKNSILIAVLVVAMLVLAIGWSPAGATFDAIQTSYVDLIVNFFKMAILAVAGISIYKLTQKKND